VSNTHHKRRCSEARLESPVVISYENLGYLRSCSCTYSRAGCYLTTSAGLCKGDKLAARFTSGVFLSQVVILLYS
jgi:hypothetical protein